MTAFFDNTNTGESTEFEVTCEVDQSPFMALTFENSRGEVLEFQTTNPTDVEEFFYQVDRAKEEWQKIKPA